MAADGEDHLAVDVDPGHLHTRSPAAGQGRAHLVVRELGDHALEGGLPAQGHRQVADVLGDQGTRGRALNWK